MFYRRIVLEKNQKFPDNFTSKATLSQYFVYIGQEAIYFLYAFSVLGTLERLGYWQIFSIGLIYFHHFHLLVKRMQVLYLQAMAHVRNEC